MLSRTTARFTCASSFSPCKGQVCTSRRRIRACARLICAAHVASRPHKSALTVQEQVMTLAHAHARVREENVARKKHYGAYLERVSPRRRGHANALSPWFCNARRCRPLSDFRALHLHGTDTSLPHCVFDDSESFSTRKPPAFLEASRQAPRSIRPHAIRILDHPRTPILHTCASGQYANVVWSDLEPF